MAYTYSYTPGSTENLHRLRYLLGDHRGVPAAYATQVTWLSTANAIHTDEELNDLLLSTMCNGNIPSAARIAMQCRVNREALNAGVAGTTDTTDRPAAIVNAIRQLERLSYPLADVMPQSSTTTNTDLDEKTDMGDDA